MKEKKYAQILPLKHTESLRERMFAVFDTETKDGLKGERLFCYGLAYFDNSVKNVVVEQDKDKKLEKLFSFLKLQSVKKLSTIIYVHNLSFDERFIRYQCVKRNIEYKIIKSGSAFLALVIESLNCSFIDCFQFLKCSQESAEKEFQIDESLRKIDCKKIFDKDYKNWSRKEKKLVLDHNKNDVLALFEIMKQFRQQTFELLNIDILDKVSIASIAMAGWRKTLKKDIINTFATLEFNRKKLGRFKVVRNEALDDFCRESYFGGRTEVFRTNILQNAVYIDFVSMFSSVMIEQKYPIGIARWSTDKSELIDIIKGNEKLAIIKCRIKYPILDEFPALPRHKNHKMIFDCCTKVGTWCSTELREAYSRGYQITPIKGAVFDESAYIFDDYIKPIFEVKKQSTGGKRKTAKTYLVALYGKFAQRSKQCNYFAKYFETEDEAIEFQHLWKDENYGYSFSAELQKYQILCKDESESIKTFQDIAIASFITANARVKLLQLIDQLNDLNAEIYYCDTDSVVIKDDESILSKINLGKELGCVDIEMKASRMQFYAPKVYAWENEKGLNLKIKGLDNITKNRELTKCKKIEDIESIFKEIDIIAAPIYSKYGTAIRKNSILASNIITKNFSFINDKRIFIGFESRPYQDSDKF